MPNFLAKSLAKSISIKANPLIPKSNNAGKVISMLLQNKIQRIIKLLPPISWCISISWKSIVHLKKESSLKVTHFPTYQNLPYPLKHLLPKRSLYLGIILISSPT